jgi:orotate phosphoribosyltransferase
MKELADKIYKTSHLTGNFKLRSGKTSTEYFDKYQFECQPELLRSIAKAMVSLIPKDTELLAGLEMGGIPIATALSLETGIPTVLVRKEAKGYGTAKLAEGPEIKNKKLCLIEDVITTGGQVALSTKDLRERGALVEHVLCVIYRGEDENNETLINESQIKMSPLFTKKQLDSWFKL